MKFLSLTHVHFIGIGGSGMAPLAQLCLSQKIKVTGFDAATNKTVETLRSQSAQISADEHDHSFFTPETVFVYSSAIKPTHSHRQFALLHKNTLLHRSELLALIAESYDCAIFVAGSHGKTTTTAMVAHLLHQAGVKPTVILGGEFRHQNTGLIVGDRHYFVTEADESDGSFLAYKPEIAIITNIDSDHLDFYKSKENILNYFDNFIANTLQNKGKVLLNYDHPDTKYLADKYALSSHASVFSFSAQSLISEGKGAKKPSPSTYHLNYTATILSEQFAKTQVTFKAAQKNYSALLPFNGTHNLSNSLAAFACCQLLNLEPQQTAEHFLSFSGVKRRFEILLDTDSLKIIDDYAHNPWKINAVVKTTKQIWDDWLLVVVFQPHRFSRTRDLYFEYQSAFKGANLVVLLPIYAANEAEIGIDLDLFAQDIAAHSGCQTQSLNPSDTLLGTISSYRGDRRAVVLFVGAGDSVRYAHELAGL